MYPMDYIWLIVVAFGIISAITNKGKPKSTNTPSNMPTFGGGAERSLRPRPSQDDDDSNVSMEMENRKQQEVYTQRDVQPTLHESDGRNVMDIPEYDVSGEGVSQMYEDSMESRNDDMQKDIDRVTAALDKISAPSSTEWNAYDNSDDDSVRSYASEISRQAANGIIWSEILGPPRAKRSYNDRKS